MATFRLQVLCAKEENGHEIVQVVERAFGRGGCEIDAYVRVGASGVSGDLYAGMFMRRGPANLTVVDVSSAKALAFTNALQDGGAAMDRVIVVDHDARDGSSFQDCVIALGAMYVYDRRPALYMALHIRTLELVLPPKPVLLAGEGVH